MTLAASSVTAVELGLGDRQTQAVHGHVVCAPQVPGKHRPVVPQSPYVLTRRAGGRDQVWGYTVYLTCASNVCLPHASRFKNQSRGNGALSLTSPATTMESVRTFPTQPGSGIEGGGSTLNGTPSFVGDSTNVGGESPTRRYAYSGVSLLRPILKYPPVPQMRPSVGTLDKRMRVRRWRGLCDVCHSFVCI